MRISKSIAKLEPIEISSLMNLYTTSLEGRGYRPLSVKGYVGAVKHFIAWAAPNEDFIVIEERSIRRFINDHLDKCDCHGRWQRGTVTVLSALNHLVDILRGSGSLPPAALALPDYINLEVQNYCGYARDVCGLAPATLISRQQWVRRFLTHHFPTAGLKLSKLGPKEVRKFFIAQCDGYQPGSAQVVASAIRSYLRFRAVRYADPVEALVAAIPSAARWRLAALPEYLETDECAKLMSAFDCKGPQSQRDYAIVRCLIDLGLRSCEVASLQLEDIDWERGILTIRIGKSKRADALPLPAITGHAIAEYLQKARPSTDSRSVFVRHRAPLHIPVNTSVIRSVVRQAATRSGLAGRLHGPHRLRHTAATRMLHGGATLKDIADILRHKSLDTTAIYAKVNVSRLSAIAQPWPDGAA